MNKLTVSKVIIYDPFADSEYHKMIGRVGKRFHWQFSLSDGRIYGSEVAGDVFTTERHCLQAMVEFAMQLGGKEATKD